MKKSINKKPILILNGLTHFDSAIYLALAPILAPIFFPKHDPIIQLIFIYGVQVISLFAKPIGAILFGLLAIKIHPIIVISYGMLGLSGSGLCIALLPSANKIGWLAPLLLVLARKISLICASGCNTISKTYLLEDHGLINPLRAMYAYNVTAMLGTSLSLIAVFGCSVNSFIYQELVWRGSFIFISCISLILLFILNKYKQNNYRPVISNWKLIDFSQEILLEIWRHKFNLMKIAIVIGATHITYVLIFGFFSKFIPLVTAIEFRTMLKLNFIFCGFDFLSLLISALLFINYKSNKVLLISGIFLTISILPIFYWLNNASILKFILISLWIIFLGVIFDCQANVWCYSLMPKKSKKYFLLGVGTALGNGLIGKTIASICWYLWYINKALMAPAIYLMILFGTASILIFTTRNKENLI